MSVLQTVVRLARSERIRRRMPAFADSLVSSLSNVLVFFLVARSFERPEPVGAFALAMVAYHFCVGATRSTVGEPLMSEYSDASPEVRRSLVGQILATTVLVSLVASLIVLGVAEVVGGLSGRALGALALVLPVLLVQDTWRFVFVIDRPTRTLAVDVVWLVAVVVALPLLPDDAGIGWFVVIWGLGAAAGAAAGFVLHGNFSGDVHPLRWLIDHRQMAWRFFGEFQIGRGVFELALAALGAIAGLGPLGAVKASVVFYGFLNTLHGGLNLALIPEGVRLREHRRKLERLMGTTATILALVSVTWMILGVALPDALGRFAFRSTWDEGRELMLPMGIAMVARGIKHGGFLGLRSLADAKRSFRVRVLTAPFEVACPVVGTVIGDAQGFVVGFAVSQVVSAGVWWFVFRQGLDDVEPKHLSRSPSVTVPPLPPTPGLDLETVPYRR